MDNLFTEKTMPNSEQFTGMDSEINWQDEDSLKGFGDEEDGFKGIDDSSILEELGI